ncbi:MAG: hypothetical protein MK165_18915 [Pirellulaceae bacterium]|nr:hypothetical protein [Pirellulaceae bacterium]
MKFIELTGQSLAELLTDDELSAEQLAEARVQDDSIVRINQQGDIEIRRQASWDILGGLLGDYEARIKKQTGFDWV